MGFRTSSGRSAARPRHPQTQTATLRYTRRSAAECSTSHVKFPTPAEPPPPFPPFPTPHVHHPEPPPQTPPPPPEAEESHPEAEEPHPEEEESNDDEKVEAEVVEGESESGGGGGTAGFVHGVLFTAGFLIVLPSGALVARYAKVTGSPRAFRLHRLLQSGLGSFTSSILTPLHSNPNVRSWRGHRGWHLHR